MSKELGFSTAKGYIETDGSVLKLKDITQDTNGVLKIGNVIIPQKILLWSGEVSSENTVSLSSNIKVGDTIEVCIKLGDMCKRIEKFKAIANLETGEVGGYYYASCSRVYGGVTDICSCDIDYTASQISISNSTQNAKLYSVYKIIE